MQSKLIDKDSDIVTINSGDQADEELLLDGGGPGE